MSKRKCGSETGHWPDLSESFHEISVVCALQLLFQLEKNEDLLDNVD